MPWVLSMNFWTTKLLPPSSRSRSRSKSTETAVPLRNRSLSQGYLRLLSRGMRRSATSALCQGSSPVASDPAGLPSAAASTYEDYDCDDDDENHDHFSQNGSVKEVALLRRLAVVTGAMEDRSSQVLARGAPFPMVVVPPNGGYWVEEFSLNHQGSPAQEPNADSSCQRYKLESDKTAKCYRRYFWGKVRRLRIFISFVLAEYPKFAPFCREFAL
ncbi:unnamed protein product [Soboliphyme baturini]|uniref:RasGEF_N_2 domain-containing protein n=1 Tax=Soboliphyme baturini TaxID=241478 RepID=A0A183IYN4_9BILA|nr:unnamed protein product [Soboliphyme baturini]